MTARISVNHVFRDSLLNPELRAGALRRAIRVELQYPVPHNLKRHAADPSRLRARPAAPHWPRSKSVRSGTRHGKLHIVCQYCKAAGRDRRPVFFTVIPDCEGLHRYRDRDRKRLSNKGNSGNKRRTVELDSQGVSPMADEQDRTPSVPDNPVVRRLIKEAHITEQQARDLIAVWDTIGLRLCGKHAS